MLPPILFAGDEAQEPYCESCGAWAEDSTTVTNVDAGDADFPDMVRNWRVDQILALPAPGEVEVGSKFQVLKANRCGTCNAFATVRASEISVSVDDQGALEFNESETLPPHVIGPEQVDLLDGLVAEQARSETS